jgi:hypothetical protein
LAAPAVAISSPVADLTGDDLDDDSEANDDRIENLGDDLTEDELDDDDEANVDRNEGLTEDEYHDVDDDDDEEDEIIMKPYQLASLLYTRRLVYKTGVGFSGTEIADPTNLAQECELQEFESLVCSANDPNEESLRRTISPPLVRLMQKKGLVKMVPHKLVLYAQTEGTTKDRGDNYVKFATNPNFVKTKSLKKGYHKLSGLAGDGYRISSTGQTYFPMVYYAWNGGLMIACSRRYMTYKKAKKHLDNGTGDILGWRRTYRGIKNPIAIYRYFVRRYKVMDNFNKLTQRRIFSGSDYHMVLGVDKKLDLAATILAIFVGPRPQGCYGQHDGATWHNHVDFLRWITISDNNRKVNQKLK